MKESESPTLSYDLKELIFTENDEPALSDIQYESLKMGIGRGESALVVSPTSTGKTQIALWAIATSLFLSNSYKSST